jgi:hypothetical protein
LKNAVSGVKKIFCDEESQGMCYSGEQAASLQAEVVQNAQMAIVPFIHVLYSLFFTNLAIFHGFKL